MAKDIQAFPGPKESDARYQTLHSGMTLRDYFAGQIAMGIVANHVLIESISKQPERMEVFVAAMAYDAADAMLAKREKNPTA